MENPTKVPKRNGSRKLSTAKLIFSAYASKQTAKITIKMHVYHNGQSSNKAVTGIRIEKGEQWDSKAREVVGNDHKTKYLRKLSTELDELYYNFQHRDRTVTAKTLLECLTKRRKWVNEVPNLAEAMHRYNESRRTDVTAKLLERRSFTRMLKWRQIVLDFCKYQYKTDNVPLDDLKPILGKELESYLRAKCKYSDVYTAKVGRWLKTCLSYAVAHEWTNRNVLALHRWRVAAKDIHALTKEELAAIESVLILDSELERVRTLFVFCCYTGLGHKDLSKLQPKHLIHTTDGIWYLSQPRSKTVKKAVVALAPVAIGILQRYADYAQRTGQLLPTGSDQDANRKLKALASLVGLSRFKLTWYVARRTCGTYLLNEGASLETVAAHLGNTPEMVRRFYAQKKDETVVKEVSKIFNRKAV